MCVMCVYNVHICNMYVDFSDISFHNWRSDTCKLPRYVGHVAFLAGSLPARRPWYSQLGDRVDRHRLEEKPLLESDRLTVYSVLSLNQHTLW